MYCKKRYINEGDLTYPWKYQCSSDH